MSYNSYFNIKNFVKVFEICGNKNQSNTHSKVISQQCTR